MNNALAMLGAVLGAAEPQPPVIAPFFVRFCGSASGFNREVENAERVGGAELGVTKHARDVRQPIYSHTVVTCSGSPADVQKTLLFLLKRMTALIYVAGVRVKASDGWLNTDGLDIAGFTRVLMSRKVLANVRAAAEPQPVSVRHFDFCFWERGQSSKYPDQALAAINRILKPVRAAAGEPVQIKFVTGVDEARRVHVRVFTQQVVPTVKLLLAKLSTYPEFMAFCNNADADDSWIPTTDRQGINALAQTLVDEWRS